MIGVLSTGDRLLTVHRRLFDQDDNRFFVGEVEAFEQGLVRATGYTFVRNTMMGTVRRKDEPRTKLISVASGTLLVYVLPRSLNVSAVQITAREAELELTDGADFHMNLSEWTHRVQ